MADDRNMTTKTTTTITGYIFDMTELLSFFEGFYLDFQMLDPIESSMTGFSRYVGWVLFSPFVTWVSNVDLSTYTHNEEPFLSALVLVYYLSTLL